MPHAADPFADRPIRVLVVDDHPMVLGATRDALLASGIAVAVDGVATLREADQRLSQATDIAIVILDLGLADAQRLDALLALREEHPDVPVVIFSGDNSPDMITSAFECSARGYVIKTQPIAALVAAVRVVLAGGSYIPPQAFRTLAREAATSASPPPVARLTARQQDVYGLLLQGMPNKVIAARLGMSVNTAKAHVSALFEALGVRNRTQAVVQGMVRAGEAPQKN